jgi:hypothetical protein
MADKLPMISDVHFEQRPDKLKIVLPVKRNWPFLLIYTLLVIMWTGMMVYGVIFLVRIIIAGASYRFVFAAMILILLFVLFRFGRFLFGQWAEYLSNREVLFINPEELIVRKPVSIWGNTTVYDMAFVTPFYRNAREGALAFNYGSHHVFIGRGLTHEAQDALSAFLNQSYFPDKVTEQTP